MCYKPVDTGIICSEIESHVTHIKCQLSSELFHPSLLILIHKIMQYKIDLSIHSYMYVRIYVCLHICLFIFIF